MNFKNINKDTVTTSLKNLLVNLTKKTYIRNIKKLYNNIYLI